VRVLADAGFDSNAFIDGVHALGLRGVIGSRDGVLNSVPMKAQLLS
jgi:hypothetical protein